LVARQRDEAKRLTNQGSKDLSLNADIVVNTTNTKKPFLSPEQKKLKKSLEQLETKISSAQSEITSLEAQISQSSELPIINDLGAKLALLQTALSQYEEQWIALSEQLDTIN
jgi:chromosome segregation ATPase